MSPSHVPKFLEVVRLAIVTCALLCVTAVPASASVTSLRISDATGDNTGGAALDITGASVTHDAARGTITSVVTFGAAPQAGASVAVGLGKMKNGSCSFGEEGDGSLAMIAVLDSAPKGIWVQDGAGDAAAFTPSVSGTTLRMATAAAAGIRKLTWNCANVAIQLAQEGDAEALGDAASGSGPVAGAAQLVVQTDKPDGDKDGVPDVADACPTVAGPTANGCLSIAAKRAVRLGAKRIAVDLMVKRTGATCRSVAKATIKIGRKTIGKGNLAVNVHGSYCHISGVVKIKKHKKKVQVTIAGSGFKKVSRRFK